MSLLPGRKTLVWITPGFPLLARGLARGEWAAFNQQVKGLSNAAIQNQIAFYSVNQSESGGGADLSSASQPTLQLFSTLTGGRWYRSDSVEMPAYFTPGSFHRPWRCGIIRRATMVAWRTLRSIVAVFFLLLAATEIFACDAIASPACPFSTHPSHDSDDGCADGCLCCCGHIVVVAPSVPIVPLGYVTRAVTCDVFSMPDIPPNRIEHPPRS